jgi:folate-binding protein YgfZ
MADIPTQLDLRDYFVREHNGVLAQDRVSHFGSTSRELAAMSEAALIPLLDASVYTLTGEDRLEFLHGQVSNQVKGLKNNESNRSLNLNVKGQVQALARVYRLADQLVLTVDGGDGETMRQHLQQHIIFDQVVINLQDSLVMSLQGSRVSEVLHQLGISISSAQLTQLQPADAHSVEHVEVAGQPIVITAQARSQAGGVDMIVPLSAVPELVRHLSDHGVLLAGQTSLEIARVTAGIATAQHESQGRALPHVIGLEHAVSYTKGCYLGQEIMARIEARGNVRSQLCGISLAHPLSTPVADGISVTSVETGKPVGSASSIVQHPNLGWIGLASLRKDVAVNSTVQLTLVEGEYVNALVTALPFTNPTT